MRSGNTGVWNDLFWSRWIIFLEWDSQPKEGIQGMALASPSRAVPQQGAQQKVRQMLGFLL